MIELILCAIIYAITLGYLIIFKYPTITFSCPNCDKITKGYIGDTCKCGRSLRTTDAASNSRLMLKRLVKLDLIKRL